jgi:septum site-determining protein MinC
MAQANGQSLTPSTRRRRFGRESEPAPGTPLTPRTPPALPASAAAPTDSSNGALGAAGPRESISIRGSHRGLEIRLEDEEATLPQVIQDLTARLTKAGDFFAGAEVTLNVGKRVLPPGTLAGLRSLLTDRFNLQLVRVQTQVPEVREAALNLAIPVDVPPMFSTRQVFREAPPRAREGMHEVVMEGACRLIEGPVRSGQTVQSLGHLVVLGDVNPGAEVISAGHLIVLGALRGVAHAGHPGKTDAVIIALRLEAAQLRVADKIARATSDGAQGMGTEIARIWEGQIIVEPYRGRLPGPGAHAPRT